MSAPAQRSRSMVEVTGTIFLEDDIFYALIGIGAIPDDSPGRLAEFISNTLGQRVYDELPEHDPDSGSIYFEQAQ